MKLSGSKPKLKKLLIFQEGTFQPLSREAKYFPRGSKYPKSVSLTSFLAYLQLL